MTPKLTAIDDTPKPAVKVTIPKPGEHFFELTKLDQIKGGPDYSSALGACVPNEQWVFVLDGTLELDVGGSVKLATPGVAVFIPSDVLHQSKVVGDKDVVFFTVKDTSYGLQGIAAGTRRTSG